MTQPEGPAELDIRPMRAPFWSRISVVWLVPVLALVISLGVAWKSYSERGVLVEISFENASGVEVGQTQLRYRDVSVGKVESVKFTADLSQVLVGVRVDQNVAPYLDEDAKFWVIRPEVTTRGISGLSTVLSGVYIEGTWNSEIGGTQTSFEGLSVAPLFRPGEQGTRVTLRTRDGRQMSAGAPILFKGIQVGRVETPRLSEAGDSVEIEAFISAPYDRRLTTATRFWDTSGFSVNVGTGGINLNVGSLAALIEGGVNFDTVFSGGAPIEPGHVFDLFDDEAAARDSLFNAVTVAEVPFSIIFDGSVSGLTTGAPVEYKGIRVGKVTAISASVEGSGRARTVRLLTNVALQPSKLGLPEEAEAPETIDFLAEAVTHGLRARLATQSLLTGGLKIELIEDPEAAPASLDRTGEPFPTIPAVDAEISDFSATAEGVFQRINALPVEELMQSAIELMDSLDRLATDENTRAAPEAATQLLNDMRSYVNSDAIQQAPVELRAALADINGLVEDIRKGGAVANLLAAIEDAKAAAANVNTATAGLPDLVAQVQALADKATALPLEDLVTSATNLVNTADGYIGTEDAAKIPGALSSALDEVRTFLAEVRQGGAVENANSALAAAQSAADAVAEAAAALPELSQKLDGLVAKAGSTLDTYGRQSSFSDQAVAALRDVREAAQALSSLSRAIERNPNSLLLGR